MGIMVYFLIMGTAGVISSAVSIYVGLKRVERFEGRFWGLGRVRVSFKGLGFRALGLRANIGHRVSVKGFL